MLDLATVRTEIIENDGRTSRISSFRLGGQNITRIFSFSPPLTHRAYQEGQPQHSVLHEPSGLEPLGGFLAAREQHYRYPNILVRFSIISVFAVLDLRRCTFLFPPGRISSGMWLTGEGVYNRSWLGCQVKMGKEVDRLVVKLPSTTRNL